MYAHRKKKEKKKILVILHSLAQRIQSLFPAIFNRFFALEITNMLHKKKRAGIHSYKVPKKITNPDVSH